MIFIVIQNTSSEKNSQFTILVISITCLFLVGLFLVAYPTDNLQQITGNVVSNYEKCVQTDAEADIYKSGLVETAANGTNLADSCVDQTHVKETYCKNGYANVETIPCPTKLNSQGLLQCNEGRCAANPSIYLGPCTDADSDGASDTGMGIYKKGTTQDRAGKATDYCMQDFSKNMVEFVCLQNVIHFVDVTCPDNMVCYNGACVQIPTCIETDYGQDKYVNGTAIGIKLKDGQFVKGKYPDECSNQQILKETYCDETGLIMVKEITCEGICEKDKCK